MRFDAATLGRRFGQEAVGHVAMRDARLPAVPVVAPADGAQAAEVLRFAQHERLRLLLAGAGEHLYLGAPMPLADIIVSTRRLARVVEYEPAERVLCAEAGLTLAAAAALAAPHGQRLGPDPWPGEAATLGGAIAADRAGPAARGRGTWRDAVLGLRVLGADGRLSKTGGKVVKNVAGYDLAKLYVGSCGSLVFIVEANVRLAPEPEATALAVASPERRRLADALLAVHRADLDPVAVLAVTGCAPDFAGGSVHLVLRFEGSAACVRAQVATARALVNAEAWDEMRAVAAYRALRRFSEPRPDAVLLRCAGLPADTARILDAIEARLGTERCAFLGQMGVGVQHVHVRDGEPEDVVRIVQALAPLGARCRVEFAPPQFAPPPGAIADAGAVQRLQAAMKSAFDPEARLRPVPYLAGAP